VVTVVSTDLEDFGVHARYMATAEWVDENALPPRLNRCPGCVTDTDRALWGRLADEVETWLGRDDQEGLFESPSVDSDSRGTAVESETKRGPDRANESDPLATVSTRPKGA
jgi:hypothetical protein